MTPNEVLEEFRSAGALLEGTSCCHPDCIPRSFCRRCSFSWIRRGRNVCAGPWRSGSRPPTDRWTMSSPPRWAGSCRAMRPRGTSGARQSSWSARTAPSRSGARGFAIPNGARVVRSRTSTTGLSSRECLAAVAEQPGRVLGAACLIDRSGGRADLGVPLVALVELDIPNYSPDRPPPELAAIPAVKPGSRNIEA